MAHHLTNGDRVLRRVQDAIRILDLLALELRQIFFHRIIQVHLAFINEHHQGRTRERLAHRGNPKHRIFAHRGFVGQTRVARRLKVEHFILACDQRNHTWSNVLVHQRLQDRLKRTLGMNEWCKREKAEKNDGFHRGGILL